MKTPTVLVEVETTVRSANKGEWVLGINGLERCPGYDHNRYRGYVVRRFIQEAMPTEFDPVQYPDSNGDGIPDAFENRLPISEILRAEA